MQTGQHFPIGRVCRAVGQSRGGQFSVRFECIEVRFLKHSYLWQRSLGSKYVKEGRTSTTLPDGNWMLQTEIGKENVDFTIEQDHRTKEGKWREEAAWSPHALHWKSPCWYIKSNHIVCVYSHASKAMIKKIILCQKCGCLQFAAFTLQHFRWPY